MSTENLPHAVDQTGRVITRGARVELHPRLDAWMSGDRYGAVETIGRVWVYVAMDRSGRTRRIAPEDLTLI